jgi:hypothetical protein
MFTFRGCVHYFAPDGGSGIIAGIPLETYSEGAVKTIVNSFGVYGIGHLLEAALLAMKPLPVVPPGQIGVYVLLPVTSAFFLLSIRRAAAVGHRAGEAVTQG